MPAWSLERVQAMQGEELVKFLLDRSILKLPETCPKCGMRVEHRDDGGSRFRCLGRKCRHSVALREGSVFEGMRLSLERMMLVLLFWANRVPLTSIHRLLMVDHEAEQGFRLAMSVRMQTETESLRVGGPGLIVEVDEMEFGRKKKGQFGKEADRSFCY